MTMFETKSVRETCAQLRSHRERGLTEQEAGDRLQENGRNELREGKHKTMLQSFWEQLNDPLIYVLMAAAVISLLLHEISDTVIIAVVVLVNAAVGMVQEGKAQKALDSLKKLTSPRAVVIRDGRQQEIPAANLTIGDLVCLEAGCQVPADLRLVQTGGLEIEESALTGESLPIAKNADFLAGEGSALGDRKNMAFMSTIVTKGRGEGLVTAVGMQTEIGKIAALIDTSPEETTPLQKRLGDLGKVLSMLSLLICGALFLLAVVQKRDFVEMLLTAISLAVAAVPEGLPAVVTICLALSVTKMVRVNTIVRKLPSVETLGAVSVVCSDKTGTLTQNKMTVVQCFCNLRTWEREGQEMQAQRKTQEAEAQRPQWEGQVQLAKQAADASLQELLTGFALCSDAVLEGEERIGDPTELALLELAASFGQTRQALEQKWPRKQELPFDSERKMMSTWHESGGQTVTYTKGAPDEILKRCERILLQGKTEPMTEAYRRQIREEIRRMSGQALRTLALARNLGERRPTEEKMTFVGLVGMQDPVRPEAESAVKRFREAGVSTVMITGDHVDTAFAIASRLGIVQRREQCMSGAEIQSLSEERFLQKLEQTRVFARVSPEHKVRIVKGLKEKGCIVAMTGDGVNDAPSLKAADIGIAMGQTGTDVAKQAADLILTDDNFATIEKAIEEGRGVYENIKKSVIFLLSSNLGEIMTMFLAVLLGLASPLKSSHILWINLITDSLPALALGIDNNDGDSLMKRPPRDPKESLFANGGLACTCFYGCLIAGISLAAFFLVPYGVLLSRQLPVTLEAMAGLLAQEGIRCRAQTYAFTVLGMSQLFHAVGMRDVHQSVLRVNHWDNKLMIAACVIGGLLQFAVTEIPFFTAAFGTARLSGREWLLLMGLAAVPLLAHEALLLLSQVSVQKARRAAVFPDFTACNPAK